MRRRLAVAAWGLVLGCGARTLGSGHASSDDGAAESDGSTTSASSMESAEEDGRDDGVRFDLPPDTFDPCWRGFDGSVLDAKAVVVLHGTDTGTWHMAQQIPINGAGPSIPASLALGDFDGDDKVDLAVRVGAQIQPYWNDGIGLVPGEPVSLPCSEACAILVGNFDVDAADEIMIVPRTRAPIIVDDLGGAPVLSSTVLDEVFERDFEVEAAVVADLNGSGTDDVALRVRRSGPRWQDKSKHVYLMIDGTIASIELSEREASCIGDKSGPMVAGDLDRTGGDELMIVSGGRDLVMSTLAVSRGPILERVWEGAIPGSIVSIDHPMHLSDVTGDGWLDLVAFVFEYGGSDLHTVATTTVWIIPGTSNGWLLADAVFRVEADVSQPVVLADVNGDGVDDLIRMEGGVEILFGPIDPDPRKREWERRLVEPFDPFARWVRAIEVADVNADGIPDLIALASD